MECPKVGFHGQTIWRSNLEDCPVPYMPPICLIMLITTNVLITVWKYAFFTIYSCRRQNQFACYTGLGRRYHYYINRRMYRAGELPRTNIWRFLHGSLEAHPHLISSSTDRGASATSDGKTTGFYSARNARIASAVLATAIPSVRLSVCLSVRPSVRLSVTRRYCVKTAARSTVQFAPLDSKICLVL